MWQSSPSFRRWVLLGLLAVFAALLATGLLLQLGVVHSPAEPSAGLSHSEDCHVTDGGNSSCSTTPTATCLANESARGVPAGCGGVPSQSSCISILGTNYCITIPSLNPASWIAWIWCVIASNVTSAAQAVFNASIAPVWNAITGLTNQIASFLSALPGEIWSVVVGFFGDLLATVNGGLTTALSDAYGPISGAVNWFFTGLLNAILNVMVALGSLFAWAGPLAPVAALATMLVILGVLLWGTVQLVRLLLNLLKTTFNLL